MPDLRREIDLPILGETISVDVTFHIIEIVERVYDMRAEYVAHLLTRPVKILRTHLADVIAGWTLGRTEHPRHEIREHVITADADTLNRYIGAIQAAVLFSLREITEEEFERLSSGKDLEGPPQEDKKKPTNGSSIAATAPQ